MTIGVEPSLVTPPRQRTGLMVLTAWVEAGDETRLIARIRRVVDVADPEAREVTSAASNAALIHAAVDEWLAELLKSDAESQQGDAAVTEG